MPPPKSGKKLTARQKAILDRWIEQGAPYAGTGPSSAPCPPALPAVKNAGVAAERRSTVSSSPGWRPKGSRRRPRPTATRSCAALSLDLIGLPPTPEEADAFVNDASPDAYEKLVDRLLASPHYGERWARRWLDLARYADTNGYEKDRPRSIWPYRDWVIDALNADMPFDQFTIEQLAGDLLPNADARAADRHRLSPQHDAQRGRRHRPAGVPLPRDGRPRRHDRHGLARPDRAVRAVPHAQVRPDHAPRVLPVHGVPQQRRRAGARPAAARRRRAGTSRARKSSRSWSPSCPDKWPQPAAGSSAEAPRELVERKLRRVARRASGRGRCAGRSLRPVEAKSNLPLLDRAAPTRPSSPAATRRRATPTTLQFANAPRGITAIRLEALPDDRLPAHGPGCCYYEGPKGDFFLSEFTLTSAAQPVKFGRATESYAKNNFGKDPVDRRRGDRRRPADRLELSRTAGRSARGGLHSRRAPLGARRRSTLQHALRAATTPPRSAASASR